MLKKNTLAKVLLINSSQALNQSIEQKKSDLACEIFYCQTGAQAQAFLSENKVQLVLSNIRFDDMLASDFLKSLPCQSYNFPVVVFADTPEAKELLPLIRLGVRDCIENPIENFNEVCKSIQWAIESHNEQVNSARLEDTNRELQRDLSELQIDLQAGRYVQRKMLPDTPKHFGQYQFSHHLIPSSYLSGDFVEYVLIGSRYVMFLIADISGHGASSAFITVLLKNITARLRSDWMHKQDETILSPALFLDKVNQEFIALESGKHATMFVGVLDMQAHHLCYSIAGHHPLPILSSEDTQEFIKAKGRPVGLFPDYEFQEHHLDLPEKFKLMLFSDGILEILPQTSLQEKEQTLLQACEFESLNSVKTLSERLGIKRSQHLPDDVAMFLLNYPVKAGL